MTPRVAPIRKIRQSNVVRPDYSPRLRFGTTGFPIPVPIASASLTKQKMPIMHADRAMATCSRRNRFLHPARHIPVLLQNRLLTRNTRSRRHLAENLAWALLRYAKEAWTEETGLVTCRPLAYCRHMALCSSAHHISNPKMEKIP